MEEEYLLFDYSLATGDTLNSCAREVTGADYPDSGEEVVGMVDSIGALDLYGANRRTLFTSGHSTGVGLAVYGQIGIAEGMGFTDSDFLRGGGRNLRDYCEGGFEVCQITTSSRTINANSPLSIYPNPSTNGLFQIDLAGELATAIKVYAVDGRLQLEPTVSGTLDLSSLDSGLYLVEIALRNGKRVIRRVVTGNSW